jgi:hypothetical protein
MTDIEGVRAHVLAAIDLIAGESWRMEGDTAVRQEANSITAELEACNGILRSPSIEGCANVIRDVWHELLEARKLLDAPNPEATPNAG